MATKKVEEIIEIKPVVMRDVLVTIKGTSPLITHAWSAKAKKQILEGELGWKNKTKVREPKDVLEEFVSSMYWLDRMPDEFTVDSVREALEGGARFGFPVTGIKQAAIKSVYRLGWAKDQVSLKTAFQVKPSVTAYYGGDCEIDFENKKINIAPNTVKYADLAEIKADPPVMREDPVTVGNGNADLRYRGEFRNWSIDFILSYNVNGKYKLEDILNMINAGGCCNGIGEWRAEKDGVSGSFVVADAKALN